jgi:phospholipid/cholesterol/gamma-HCH transport system substrate-binding protein
MKRGRNVAMSRQVSTFMIGLFVAVGIIIGVSVIVWIGASQYFEKGNMYVTYFDESVQGLQRDSSVKYRGVDVGRIVKIGVAPDNKLVEVVMKINLKDAVEKNSLARLRAAGITGIVFVELDQRDPKAPDMSPKIDFATEYPIIASRPSEVRQILSGIYEVVDKIHGVDFRGISDQIKLTAKAADDFLAGRRMKQILANLESSTMALNRSMTRLDKITSEGNLEDTLSEAKQTLSEARSFITGVKNDLQAMKLSNTADKANQAVDILDRTVRSAAVDIQTSTENIRRASDNLDRLLERLDANPSELIFGRKPEQRR